MSMLDPPSQILQLLQESVVPPIEQTATDEAPDEVLSYVAFLAAGLAEAQEFNAAVWKEALTPYLEDYPQSEMDRETVVETFRQATQKALVGEEDDAESVGEHDDDEQEICDLRFNLAYGGKILLHNTKLRLLRGRRYALVGQNGVGKTTLMNAIHTNKIDGWPSQDVVSSAYVDSGSNVDPQHEAQLVMPYLMKTTSKSKDECVAKLQELEFTDEMMDGTIGALSGGWQMKLRLVMAVLLNPDIYLMDEPTNHLSKSAVDWITQYCQNLQNQTILVVSHDTTFLENVCTDVIHYEQRDVWGPYRRLVHYRSKMSEFVELQPEAKHYFELATTDAVKYEFPEPGRLEGVRTSTQKFLEMEHVNFKYESRDRNTLTDIHLKMTLSSRVAVLGANGAGKTTLIKMIVGETVPSNLGVCKFYIHPNLRIAYVAQHAFSHVEQHMEESPVAYIQWRFKDGWDREKLESKAFRIPPEEQAAIDDFGIEGIWSRRMKAGKLEYEVKKRNVPEKNNKYYTRDELMALGFEHLIKQTDEKIASREAGLDLRPVTTTEIQKHLDGFGLAQEFGTYGKIRGLSGGQKVKLVLAAAFWTVPHLVILDEPTNYLDRENLGALSAALNEWGGAVLMISHNHEFYSSVCKEEWDLVDGHLTVRGTSDERAMKAVSRKKKFEKEDTDDQVLDKAGGNTNTDGDRYKEAATINFWGNTVSKKEARAYEKSKKKGDIAGMRKALQIPAGKIMPGYEMLGDGTGKEAT